MIKFIRKHTPGPLSARHFDNAHSLVTNESGWIIQKFNGGECGHMRSDADLFSAAPEMLDCLITVATELESGLEYLESLPEDITNQIPQSMDKFKKEFNYVIELIKKAGVEVVE